MGGTRMNNLVAFTLQMMDGDLQKISASLQGLSDELVWRRFRESTNSVGNLILHLAGAEYQRVSSAIGGKELVRERTLEFTTEGGLSAAELLEKLRLVRTQSKEILAAVTDQELDQEIPMYFKPDDWQRMLQHSPNYNPDPTYKPQKTLFVLFGLANHYSYHTGQIVMLAKQFQQSNEQILQFKH
ncbi:DUF664 domain-containing protein [Paenibacillus thalictri]|uniref:DUF664 domain-containing protein n=2 Tax=Paenibacillus thalictri TaxID=2527873 RepID=A0A4Q9DSG1_9BACL|nr:DUF664 domain-containing protein [Paenibacillus thalictri]